MKSDYEKLIEQGYTTEEITPDLSEVSSIDISTSPMSENREDKSVSVTNSTGTSKKTSSIMMGYNKANIKLPDGSYISLDELEAAIDKEFAATKENTVIVVKKTGKKVDVSALKAELRKALDKKAKLSLDGKSDKIVNQETEKVSIKGEGSKAFVGKGVFMFGNDGMNMSEGEYVNREGFSEAISEYQFMTPGNKPEVPTPEIEVVSVEPSDKIKKKYKKGLIVAGGLTAVSLATLPLLIPGIMHANSVLWNHTTNPIFQGFLHNICNCNLAKLIGATYNEATGVWTATNGILINANAASSSLIAALATHAVNTSAIGIAAKKVIDAIKKKREEKRSKKLEQLNAIREELTNSNSASMVNEGGLSI